MKKLLCIFTLIIIVSSCKSTEVEDIFVEYRNPFCGTFYGMKTISSYPQNPNGNTVTWDTLIITKSEDDDSSIVLGSLTIKINAQGSGHIHKNPADLGGGNHSLDYQVHYPDTNHVIFNSTFTDSFYSNTTSYNLYRVQ